MSIRLRFVLTYSLMFLTTIVFFVLTAYFLTVATTGDFKSIKDIYQVHYTLKPLTPEEESLFVELKYMSKQAPDQLLDLSLLKEYDFKLRVAKSALYVRKEQETVFASPAIGGAEIVKALPAYELDNFKIRDSINVGNRFFAYSKYDFTFSDKQRGSVFVIRELSPYSELVRKLLPALIAVLALALLLTNGLLYRYVNRSIVRPLRELREATDKMREGDLGFAMNRAGREAGTEIRELRRAFELMRQKLKESIELQLQYEENRKQLITNISHDLKTPLTTIRGYVEGIREGVAATPEKLDQYLATIHGKAADMDRLIDELFLFSKLDLKRVPFAFERVELSAYLDDVAQETQIDLHEKGIDLQWHNEASEPVYTIADREKLKRALMNIIDNSVKYMHRDDKRIDLRLTAEPQRLVLEIADNGPGIEAACLPYIFDRFYRAEPSRGSSSGGSGLGLAIARQIVEEHGGSIWAESRPNEHTSVFIALKRTE